MDFGTFGWNFGDFVLKKYQNKLLKKKRFGCTWHRSSADISIFEQHSAARGDFFYKKDWDCKIFDSSYFLGPT